jgi:hypothetical protein
MTPSAASTISDLRQADSRIQTLALRMPATTRGPASRNTATEKRSNGRVRGPPRCRALARRLLLRCAVDSSKFEAHDEQALEVQVGKARVVVALDQVDRIIETLCTPMPRAHRLVRGIGFDERRPIVCIVLSGKPVDLAPQAITAVLLASHGPVVWALCADRVFGVVTLVGRSTAYDARWPRWLSRVRSQDGRTLAQLDGAQMAIDIGGSP